MRLRVRARILDDRGVTVIELAMAVSLSLLILFAVFAVLDSGTRSERTQQAGQETLVSLRTAMTRMTKDIRQAVSVSPTSTRSRLVMRTIVAGNEKDMVYEVNSSSELLRIINGAPPGTPLARRLSTNTVFCFDPPNCTMASPTAATLTRIRITLTGTPAVGSTTPITFATDVELRNI